MPAADTLSFRTNVRLLDLYFLFDRSGSMASEIRALRAAVATMIDELECTATATTCALDRECGTGLICGPDARCVEDPSIAGCVPSIWTGGGWYVDGSYGNVRSLSADPVATASALSFSTSGATEELFRAVARVVAPAAGAGTVTGCASPMPGTLGCPAFRSDAVRLLVAFTDEDSDGLELAAEPAALLVGSEITFLGVWSGYPGSSERTDLVDLARLSGSLDAAGMPLVFEGADAAVVPAVTSAVREIVQRVPLRVTIEATDEPGDDGDALAFVARIEAGAGPDCAVLAAEDADGDGDRETYPAVTPGARVCWDVVARDNVAVPPIERPQVFRARLTVRGDGSPLDARTVYFLVPPAPPEIEIPM